MRKASNVILKEIEAISIFVYCPFSSNIYIRIISPNYFLLYTCIQFKMCSLREIIFLYFVDESMHRFNSDRLHIYNLSTHIIHLISHNTIFMYVKLNHFIKLIIHFYEVWYYFLIFFVWVNKDFPHKPNLQLNVGCISIDVFYSFKFAPFKGSQFWRRIFLMMQNFRNITSHYMSYALIERHSIVQIFKVNLRYNNMMNNQSKANDIL